LIKRYLICIALSFILMFLPVQTSSSDVNSSEINYTLVLSDPKDDVMDWDRNQTTDEKPYIDIKQMCMGNNETMLFIKCVMYGNIKDLDNGTTTVRYTIIFDSNQTTDGGLWILAPFAEYVNNRSIFAGKNITGYSVDEELYFEIPLQHLWDEGCVFNGFQLTGGFSTRETYWAIGGNFSDYSDGVGRFTYNITKYQKNTNGREGGYGKIMGVFQTYGLYFALAAILVVATGVTYLYIRESKKKKNIVDEGKI